jgi:hypothetical protein
MPGLTAELIATMTKGFVQHHISAVCGKVLNEVSQKAIGGAGKPRLTWILLAAVVLRHEGSSTAIR